MINHETAGVSTLSLSASGAFPSTPVGSSNTITITASNASAYTASSVSVTALSAPFAVANNTCGATVAASGSCTFDVTFSPSATGVASDTATVAFNNGAGATSATLALSATGTNIGSLFLSVADASNKISTYTCTAVTVSAKDGGGSALAVTQSTQVTLSGLGAGLAYATLPNCRAATSSVSNVFLNIGDDHLVFYYRTATAESLTLQAAATAFASASLAVTTVLFQVLGQVDAATLIRLSKGESAPRSVHSDGTRLFVVDSSNNRVLVWNTLPSSNGQAASFVLGQPDLVSNTAYNGGLSASSMNNPYGVYSDGTRLFVVERGNNRVLVWNTMPSSNGQAASFALGQPDLTSGRGNNGGLSASSMNAPRRVNGDGIRLFVADTNNNRVLVWNTIPSASGQAASFALGQPNLTSNTFNNGGLSASSMNGPWGAYSDGTRLFVADYVNHRVLVWNTIPSASGQAASFALGQPNLTSNTINNGGLSGSTMFFPIEVYSDGTRLFVADSSNNRVLAWNTMPSANGQTASSVLGQPDLASNSTNNVGISATSMNIPAGVYSDGVRLFVADNNNHRVLVWNTMPTSNGQAADFALGQPDLISGTSNNGGRSASTMNSPFGVYSDGTRLFVADTNNHRVLVWNTMPTTSGQAASFALGQPDLTSGTYNNGGLSASSMGYPYGVHGDGTRLFVVDNDNGRVLVWNTIPTTSGQAASFALGQPNLTSGAGTCNNGGRSASTMCYPTGVFSDATRLFVADFSNHRVLVWTTMPTTSGQAASFALGQPDLTSGTANNGGLSASSLNKPFGVFSDGTLVVVSDSVNNRVLVWSAMPTTSGQAASLAFGQPGLTSNTANNGGLSATSMSQPYGVFSDGTRVVTADSVNNRVLISPLP